MWDEDPDYNPWGIENVDVDNNTGVRKMLIDGQLYILRDSEIHNLISSLKYLLESISIATINTCSKRERNRNSIFW